MQGDSPYDQLQNYHRLQKAIAEGSAVLTGPLKLASEELNRNYTALRSLGNTVAAGGIFGLKFKPVGAAEFYDFPLSAEALRELEGLCSPAPFGMGAETVLDPDVRKALTSDLGAFDIQIHPQEIEDLKTEISAELFPQIPPENMKLVPYRLNVYNEGGFFRAHRDAVRTRGELASLVISLPCPHRGGQLKIQRSDANDVLAHPGSADAAFSSQPGRVSVVDFSRSTFSPFQWAAFPTDCLHEILPVEEGTRVTITFQVVYEPSPPKPDEPPKKAAETPAGKSLGTKRKAKVTLVTEVAKKKAKYLGSKPGDIPVSDLLDKKSGDGLPKILCNFTLEAFHGRVSGLLRNHGKIGFITEHLYTDIPLDPLLLKGPDRRLYDVLAKHFEVEVVCVLIDHSVDVESGESRWSVRSFDIFDRPKVTGKACFFFFAEEPASSDEEYEARELDALAESAERLRYREGAEHYGNGALLAEYNYRKYAIVVQETAQSKN